MENSSKLLALYIVLFVLRYACVLVFLLPKMDIEFAFVSVALFVITGISFALASCKDPGFVAANESPYVVYEKYKPEYICPYCSSKKARTTRHCPHCKRCVKVTPTQHFDHHCPWIRNCIGYKNHLVFMIFLSFCCMDFIFHGAMGVLDFTNIFTHDHQILPDMPTNHKIASLGVACYCALALAVVFPIWYVQVTNIIKNTTTHQRFAYNGVKANDKDSKNTDTQSMLIGEPSEWASIAPRQEKEREICCCWGKSKRSVTNNRINYSKPSVM